MAPTTKKNEKQETAVATRPAVSPIYQLATRFHIDPAKLTNVLRGTVIKPDKNGKPATDEEVAAFCIVADQYGLNPFTREIHAFTSSEKGVTPIVGIDGWVKIVNSQKDFDGCQFEYGDDENGKLESVTCLMHIKGRSHPVECTEYMAECKRNTGPWNQHPRRMLRHKAYMQTARIAFGLSGIYDEDEAHDIVQFQATAEPDRSAIPMPKEIEAEVTTPAKEPKQAEPAAAPSKDQVLAYLRSLTSEQNDAFIAETDRLTGEGMPYDEARATVYAQWTQRGQ